MPCPEPSVVPAFSLSSILSLPFFSAHSISSAASSTIYSTSTNCFCVPGQQNVNFPTFSPVPGHRCHLQFPFLQYFLLHSFLHILLVSQSLPVSTSRRQALFVSLAKMHRQSNSFYTFCTHNTIILFILNFCSVHRLYLLFSFFRPIHGTYTLSFFNSFFAILFSAFY